MLDVIFDAFITFPVSKIVTIPVHTWLRHALGHGILFYRISWLLLRLYLGKALSNPRMVLGFPHALPAVNSTQHTDRHCCISELFSRMANFHYYTFCSQVRQIIQLEVDKILSTVYYAFTRITVDTQTWAESIAWLYSTAKLGRPVIGLVKTIDLSFWLYNSFLNKDQCWDTWFVYWSAFYIKFLSFVTLRLQSFSKWRMQHQWPRSTVSVACIKAPVMTKAIQFINIPIYESRTLTQSHLSRFWNVRQLHYRCPSPLGLVFPSLSMLILLMDREQLSFRKW